MQIITGQPPEFPHHCAVHPYKTGTVEQANERFLDTKLDFECINAEQWLVKGRLYLSEAAVSEMAQKFGLPTREDHTVALAQRDAALDALERVREERNELRREIEAIDYLGSKDFIARKKVGRPKQPTQKAA